MNNTFGKQILNELESEAAVTRNVWKDSGK